jgi:hypothetical protein
MKKLFITLILSVVVLTSLFSITDLEKMLLPEFKGDLSTVSYKIIEKDQDVMVVVIDGIAYLVKLK